MSRFSFKGVLAVVTAMMLFSLVPAFAAAPCATLAYSIDKTVVARGETITATASIKNCSASKQTYTVKYTILTPVGNASMGSAKVALAAGETRNASLSYTVPAWVPPGDYIVSATVLSGSQPLTTASATITVQ